MGSNVQVDVIIEGVEQALYELGTPFTVQKASLGPTVLRLHMEPGSVVQRVPRTDLESRAFLALRAMGYGVSGRPITPDHVRLQAQRYDPWKSKRVQTGTLPSLADDVALALGVDRVWIEREGGDLWIDVPVERAYPLFREGPPVIVKEDARGRDWEGVRFGVLSDGSGTLTSKPASWPHMLIGGSTGSGKSNFLHLIIRQLLAVGYKLYLIDTKMIELGTYRREEGVVIATTPDDAVELANSFLQEMELRYTVLSDPDSDNDWLNRLVPSALIVDELADLVQVKQEFLPPLTRIAQKGRAAFMHAIVATQRPSVDVVDGKTKANFSARVAFAVPTKVDSRVILDSEGAEYLLGSGDGLFRSTTKKPVRFQAYLVE